MLQGEYWKIGGNVISCGGSHVRKGLISLRIVKGRPFVIHSGLAEAEGLPYVKEQVGTIDCFQKKVSQGRGKGSEWKTQVGFELQTAVVRSMHEKC